MATSHSESDGSINRYKNEEEATFDTLGILQPILQEDDHNIAGGGNIAAVNEILGDPMNLMQPILLDDEDKEHEDEGDNVFGGEPVLGGTSSAFTSSSPAVVMAKSSTALPPQPPPPPPPPGKVVSKQRADKSLPPEHLASSSTSLSSKNMSTRSLSKKPAMVKKATKKDLTQFEDEADLAILAALNSYNMQSTTEGASIATNIQKHKGISPVHDEEKEEDDESSKGQGYIPTHITRRRSSVIARTSNQKSCTSTPRRRRSCGCSRRSRGVRLSQLQMLIRGEVIWNDNSLCVWATN